MGAAQAKRRVQRLGEIEQHNEPVPAILHWSWSVVLSFERSTNRSRETQLRCNGSVADKKFHGLLFYGCA